MVRLAFFSTAPFAIVLLAALFPVTGALVQATRRLERKATPARFVAKSTGLVRVGEAHV